jgi:hypothetical protein
VYVLGGGEDATIVFLTADMQQAIAKSGVFKAGDIPLPA